MNLDNGYKPHFILIVAETTKGKIICPSIGLAKKFVPIFPLHLSEKP